MSDYKFYKNCYIMERTTQLERRGQAPSHALLQAFDDWDRLSLRHFEAYQHLVDQRYPRGTSSEQYAVLVKAFKKREHS